MSQLRCRWAAGTGAPTVETTKCSLYCHVEPDVLLSYSTGPSKYQNVENIFPNHVMIRIPSAEAIDIVCFGTLDYQGLVLTAADAIMGASRITNIVGPDH